MFEVPKSLLENPSKALFHRSGNKLLRALAAAVGLEAKTFDVRSCLGGPGVMGEVILHTSHFYIQLFIDGTKPRLLYRTCKGQKDYTGGRNDYVWLGSLVDDSRRQFVVILKRMHEQGRIAAIHEVPQSKHKVLVA